jgi:hypothetical protein
VSDFDRPSVGVSLRDGGDVVDASLSETLIVVASRLDGLSIVGFTVVVETAGWDGRISAVAPTLFNARYERYEGPEVLACRVGAGRGSLSSIMAGKGERLVHRSINRSVVSLGRFSRRARP